jgi:hypothetical protein
MFASLTVIGVCLMLTWIQQAFLRRMIVIDIAKLRQK